AAAHGDRVPAPRRPRPPPRARQDARPADPRGVPVRQLRQRPDHRQPRQAAAPEARRRRPRRRRHRDGLRPGLPLAGVMRRLLRFASRIGVGLLLFTLLLVFLPVWFFLYLGVYEKQLLETQERSMVQQGRLVAAALGDAGPLAPASAAALLHRLEQR